MKKQIAIFAMTVLASVSSFAAAGGSTPPTPNTELKTADGSDFIAVMTDYSDVQKFKVKVKLNGKVEERGVDFVLAGRFEPDAPIPQNVLVLKTTDYPQSFKTGSIVVKSIKQIGASSFELKGIGGYWYGSDEQCPGKWVFVERTIEIKMAVKNSSGYEDLQPTFGKVTDVEVCR